MSTETNRLADALVDSADRLDVAGPSLDDVVGRARVIRRNRRLASGVAAAAAVAVIAPVGVLAMNGSGDGSSSPAPATQEPSPAPVGGGDYLLKGAWHQADGDVVELPQRDYDSAVVWNDQLVATYYDGEYAYVAEVISDAGEPVDRFTATGPVVTNDDHTGIAYVDTEGHVMTRGDDGEWSLGKVDLSAPGEGIAWEASGFLGGPDCQRSPNMGRCVVYVDNNLGERPRAFDGVQDGAEVSDAWSFRDVSDGHGLASVTSQRNDDTSVCGGVYDLDGGGLRFETCEYDVQQISPDGRHVAAPPSMYDGLGVTSLSVLDAVDGAETGRYAPEGGHIAQWAWGDDGRLVFDAYDGANWHLFAMESNGTIEELTDPVEGPDMDSPFTLIQH